MWVWVNVHGSWPFGLAYLVLRMVGRRVDGAAPGRLPRLLGIGGRGHRARSAPTPSARACVAYPLSVLTHHQAFAHIVEWHVARASRTPSTLVFLAAALVAFVLLVARRGTVEDVLVAAAFTAAALTPSRNVPVAALLITPVLARGVAGLGTSTACAAAWSPASALAALVAVGAVVTAGALRRPAYDLSPTPWPRCRGCRSTISSRAGWPPPTTWAITWSSATARAATAFVDDRVDVFPRRSSTATASC